MGRFKPNGDYVYENVDGVIYAREVGSLERFEIGKTSERVKKEELELEFWMEVIRESQYNSTLQKELERVKLVYLLMKQDTAVQHHPV
jgi:hypothetical protein